jgi:hypothetical protein
VLSINFTVVASLLENSKWLYCGLHGDVVQNDLLKTKLFTEITKQPATQRLTTAGAPMVVTFY